MAKTKTELPAGPALKMADACRYLGGISNLTMYRLVKAGKLRANKTTRQLLFPIAELDRMIRDGMT